MRSLIARLALVGTVGAALAGCGTTNGSSLPVGAPLNGTAGGPVAISNQPAPGGSLAGKVIDNGILTIDGKYTGFNTNAVDSQSATENGTDPVAAARPPADPGTGQPAGSHAIAFDGNGALQLEFLFNSISPINLTYTGAAVGQIQPATYGAIVLFVSRASGATPAVPPPAKPTINLEITGGTGTTAFDTRIACKIPLNAELTPVTATTAAGFDRYVCALPAYGASVSQPTENPVSATATTGTFTPQNVKLYVVLSFPFATTTLSTGNTLGIDTVYAEQGTI